MWLLGIKYLIVTNAAGGLNPLFQRGEIMLINSHLDLMFRGSTNSRYPECLHRPLLRADAYDESLINLATKIARRNDIHLHRGVYASLLGPTYETRAEYRMLRRIGADAVGMSTVPEVTVAAQLKMAILGLSVITNLAKPDALASTSGQEVVRAARTAAPNVLTIVQSLIADLG
jgi:purine-nucleoside phosphorylase